MFLNDALNPLLILGIKGFRTYIYYNSYGVLLYFFRRYNFRFRLANFFRRKFFWAGCWW